MKIKTFWHLKGGEGELWKDLFLKIKIIQLLPEYFP